MMETSTRARFDVLGIGLAVRDISVVLDRFPRPDRKMPAREIVESGGGPVPTALVTLARLGNRVAFGGLLGKDEVGRFILEGLEREGVDTTGVTVRSSLRSPTAVIVVEQGRRTILEWPQVDPGLRYDDLLERGVAVRGCKYVLVDGRFPEAQIGAAREARAAAVRVVIDCGHPRPQVDELLGLADVAILSHTYPAALHGESYDRRDFLQDLWTRLPEEGLRVAGLTLGARGCVLYRRDGSLVHLRGHPVEALDTTGAGDVFHGAFVHALLRGDGPERAARFANAAAALKCRGLTGRSPLPGEDAIDRFAGL